MFLNIYNDPETFLRALIHMNSSITPNKSMRLLLLFHSTDEKAESQRSKVPNPWLIITLNLNPAFKDGWERLQYLLFGCPIFIYVARFPFEESLLTLGYGLLGPERGPHSPQPWVTLRARPAWVQCQGFMVTLLPRVCPDRSIPVRNTLLWSGSWSQGAVPALASLASP